MKPGFSIAASAVTICLVLSVSGCAQRPMPPSVASPYPPVSSPLPATIAPATATAFPTPTATPRPSPQSTPVVEGDGPVTTTEPQPQFVPQVILIDTTHPMTSVCTIEWETDNLVLHYALGDLRAEPKDWAWWRYELGTGTKEPLPAPVSHVPDAVRAQLGLCVEADLRCWMESNLFESPSGTQMAYGPIGSQGFEVGNGELWIANVDGSNRRLVPAFLPGPVEWSLKEDFLLVDAAWSEWPEGFLVRVDDLAVNELLDLVAMESCESREIRHAAPHFSPDGGRIAFVGGQLVEETEVCSLWEVDVDGSNLRRLSEHVGGVQWATNSQILYVLEHRFRPQNGQEFALYRIDTRLASPQVELLADALPYYGFPSSVQWAVSPDETMIAYTDACDSGTLCIVRFAPAP